MTPQMVALLGALLGAPADELYGFELAKRAGLKSGTIYPALARLARMGWLEWSWEEIDPKEEGRPRRRLYKLTGVGETSARRELDELLQRVERAARTTGAQLGRRVTAPA